MKPDEPSLDIREYPDTILTAILEQSGYARPAHGRETEVSSLLLTHSIGARRTLPSGRLFETGESHVQSLSTQKLCCVRTSSVEFESDRGHCHRKVGTYSANVREGKGRFRSAARHSRSSENFQVLSSASATKNVPSSVGVFGGPGAKYAAERSLRMPPQSGRGRPRHCKHLLQHVPVVLHTCRDDDLVIQCM